MASLARRDVAERADRRPQFVVPAAAGGLARLEAAHVPVELREYAGIGHVRILAALSNPDSDTTPTLADVVRFVEEKGDAHH